MDRAIVIGAVSFAVTASLLAIPTFAQADGRMMTNEPTTRAELEARLAEHFAQADADSDGQVTREEADAHHAQRRAEMRARVFDRMDANDDGEVSAEERDAARQAMHARRAERREARRARHAEYRADAWNSADADASGGLSEEEFAALDQRVRERLHERREVRGDRAMRHRGRRGMRGGPGVMFEHSDANDDGVLTLAELQARPLEMFDRADADGDGTVTPEERRAAREAHRAERRQNRGS